MSDQVFDKQTLESEIQTNKQKAREKRRTLERMLEEEKLLNERQDYIERQMEMRKATRERRYKKMAFTVLKAYFKKMQRERGVD